jgi:hypothetical protein
VITDGAWGSFIFFLRLSLPPELLSCETPKAIVDVETQIIPVEITVEFPNASFLGLVYGCFFLYYFYIYFIAG